MMAIVKLIHTGKKDETTDGEELLGYKRIEVETVSWDKKHHAFIADVFAVGSNGTSSFTSVHVEELQADINNGYLAQETKGGE